MYTKTFNRWLLCALFIVLAALPARAAPPQTMSYQGYLTSNTGVPVNATVSVQFSLYAAATGGSALWTETQSVTIANGNYSVVLGNITPFGLPFDVPYYLGVTIGTDAEMTPRATLSMAPYAFRAVDANSVASVAGSSITGAITSATIAGSQITGAISSATLSGTALTQLDGRYAPATINSVPQDNIITTVDTGALVGEFTSITIGADGLPVISYYDSLNSRLKVAKCGNAACSAGNTLAPVDSTASVGEYSSITIGTDGLPVISYYDNTNGDLKVAKCVNAACTGTSTITTVDSTGNVGQYSSLAIGIDGLPVISYYDVTNQSLKVAKCINAACTGTSTLTTVDSSEGHTSIAIGADGIPVISYLSKSVEPTFYDLKVVKCINANCTTTFISTVDSAFDVGFYSSITIGTDGLPVISYYDGTTPAFKTAQCSNAACTGTSIITVVPGSGAFEGQYTSITIGADGLPVISSYYATNQILRVVKCANTACTASGALSTVDATGNVGQYTSITIGADGLPVISYFDQTNGKLKVAKCTNAFCRPYFRRR